MNRRLSPCNLNRLDEGALVALHLERPLGFFDHLRLDERIRRPRFEVLG